MTSSKIYYLKDGDGKVWFVTYHNGICWRYVTSQTRNVSSMNNRWLNWVGNPVTDLCLTDSIRVNNFKEKPDVSN